MARDQKTLRYAPTHEWVHVQAGKAVVGITAFAVAQLQDLVYIDLPEVGMTLDADDTFASIESVKALNDFFAPVAGTVTRVNTALEDSPEIISKDPYGRGWIIELRVTDDSNLASLMTHADYQAEIDRSRSG